MSTRLKKKDDDKTINEDSNPSAVPMFLWKLVTLLKEPDSQKYASWTEDGTSFIIHDQANFAKLVLPKYFKHNKFASFVRQLNMYGFRKVTSVSQGSYLGDLQQSVEFHHPFFVEDELQLLSYIKRKVAPTNTKQSSEELHQVLDEVNDVKENQVKLSSSLSHLKQENENLWREVVSLRQKHSQQQKVVNHLIKFLVSIIQHNGMGTKRRMPLMIDNESSASSSTEAKRARHSSKTEYEPGVPSPSILDSSSKSPLSTDGPLITELLSSNPSPAVPQREDDSHVPTAIGIVSPQRNKKSVNVSDFLQRSTTLIPSSGDVAIGSVSPESSPHKIYTVPFSPDNSPKVVEPSSYLNIPKSTSSNNQTSNSSEDSVVYPESSGEASSPNKKVKTSSVVAMPTLTSPDFLADDLNLNMDKISSNLQSIKQRLSNSEQIHLDYDILQELFNGSTDITPNPNIMDYHLPSTSSEGLELVQYNRGFPDPATDEFEGSESDLNDIFNSLKD